MNDYEAITQCSEGLVTFVCSDIRRLLLLSFNCSQCFRFADAPQGFFRDWLFGSGSGSRETFDFAAGARQVHSQRVGAAGAVRK